MNSVVEQLDVFADRFPRAFAMETPSRVDQLVLQRAEEALRHCMIPTVGAGSHATFDAVGLEYCAVVTTRMSNATIRMADRSSRPPRSNRPILRTAKPTPKSTSR
jgi:hypothetical protein